MTLENHPQSAGLTRSDSTTSQTDKQSSHVTSPTSPIDVVAATQSRDYQAAQRKHVVYYPSEQVPQGSQYPFVSGYPVQYYQNMPHGFQTYHNGQASNTSQQATPTSVQPPPSPTTPGLLPQHYATNSLGAAPQSPLIQHAPQQYIQTAQTGQVPGTRTRFTGPSGAIVYQRGTNNPMYVPVAAQPQQVAMLVQGQYGNTPKNYDIYRNNKLNSNNTVQTIDADYRKLDPQQQVYALQHAQASGLPIAQQHRPLMQIPQNYQHQVPSYAYLSGPPKR